LAGVNLKDKKPDLNNLEPVAGEPGWYFDHVTGRTISEEELGGYLGGEEGPSGPEEVGYENGLETGEDSDYEQFDEDRGGEGETSDEDNYEDQKTEDETEEDSREDPHNESGEENNPKESGGEDGYPSPSGGDGGKKGSPTDALDALPTNQMGEAGEKIDQAKDLIKDAEDVAKAIETEGADLAADWRLLKKYGPEAVKTQMMVYGLIVGGFIIVFTLIIIFIMALLGYGGGGDSAYGTTPGTTTGIAVGDWYMPVDVGVGFKIVSEYGWRTHPTLGIVKFHYGVDISIPGDGDLGLPIYSINSGTIISIINDGTCGYGVSVSHSGGYSSSYCHMIADSQTVRKGDSVSGGQMIGKIGSTGQSTGPHLHLGTKLDGIFFNPRDILDFSKL
jgi:murein DD-endopeptidase MepM/ murein hydrolase activator NlpD